MSPLSEFFFDPMNAALAVITVLAAVVMHFFTPLKITRTIAVNFAICLAVTPLLFSDFLQIGTPRPYNIVFYVITFDVGYYWVHRLFHHSKFHFLHHRRLANPLQCLDFSLFEFVPSLAAFIMVGQLFPLTRPELIAFYTSYFILQLLLHTGGKAQWPIFISPMDHHIHHTRHHYNFASVFKFSDVVFGTYRAEPARRHASEVA